MWWSWLEAEYHQTSHRGIGGQTPLDRFLEDNALIRPAPDNLDDMMRMQVSRKVNRDRTLRLRSRVFEAPDGYAGETVEVLFDPFDLTRPVHMRRRGETTEIALKRLDLVANAEIPREDRAEEGSAGEEPLTGISYLDLVADQFYAQEQ